MKKFLLWSVIGTGLIIAANAGFCEEAPAGAPGSAAFEPYSSGHGSAAVADHGNNPPATNRATSFDPAAATQAWLDIVPKEKREKSDAYFEGGYWLLLWDYVVAAAISVLLLSTRMSARLRDFADRPRLRGAGARDRQREIPGDRRRREEGLPDLEAFHRGGDPPRREAGLTGEPGWRLAPCPTK